MAHFQSMDPKRQVSEYTELNRHSGIQSQESATMHYLRYPRLPRNNLPSSLPGEQQLVHKGAYEANTQKSLPQGRVEERQLMVGKTTRNPIQIQANKGNKTAMQASGRAKTPYSFG
jgi:hypothetical protein